MEVFSIRKKHKPIKAKGEAILSFINSNTVVFFDAPHDESSSNIKVVKPKNYNGPSLA